MAKENTIKSFVLRIDSSTMDALEAWSAAEFRSINGQLQWIIADALRRSGRLRKPAPEKPEKPAEPAPEKPAPEQNDAPPPEKRTR